MYRPEALTENTALDRVVSHIQSELERIGNETQLPQPEIGVLLPKLHVAPTKPRQGLVVFADGTNWNPGAGAGIYAYHSGVWNKLG